jgi:hypothetical protein
MYNVPDDRFNQLKKHLRLRMKEEMVDEKVRNITTHAFEHSLASENVILSRPERIRLFRALLQDIFDDLSNSL